MGQTSSADKRLTIAEQVEALQKKRAKDLHDHNSFEKEKLVELHDAQIATVKSENTLTWAAGITLGVIACLGILAAGIAGSGWLARKKTSIDVPKGD